MNESSKTMLRLLCVDAANARTQRRKYQFECVEPDTRNDTTDRAADRSAQRRQSDDVREFEIDTIIVLVKALLTLLRVGDANSTAQLSIRTR